MSYLRDRARRRRTYAELLELDDRMLRDIGLRRSDLFGLRTGRKPGHD